MEVSAWNHTSCQSAGVSKTDKMASTKSRCIKERTNSKIIDENAGIVGMDVDVFALGQKGVIREQRVALASIDNIRNTTKSINSSSESLSNLKRKKDMKGGKKSKIPRVITKLKSINQVHPAIGNKSASCKQKRHAPISRTPLRLTPLVIEKPPTSAVFDDDFLPMDIDYAPSLHIRLIQTRLPQGVPRLEEIDSYPTGCADYIQDIYKYLLSVESRHVREENSITNNCDVKPHMRAILVDWLIQVQVHQDISQQTLHLTVALVDKVMYLQMIDLSVLQLLGVSSLLVAAKFVERFPPEIETLCHLTDNTYNKEQVLQMERQILEVLNFDLNICEPIVFLDRFIAVEKECPRQVEYLSKYILDLSLVSTHFAVYVPSVMAASAVLLSRRLLLDSGWTNGLNYYTMYAERDLNKCCHALAKLLKKAPLSKFQGARQKYSSPDFGRISEHAKVCDPNAIKIAAYHGQQTVIM